jgi:folate-binding protein YgfZ
MLAARFTGGLAAWQPWYYLNPMAHLVEDRGIIALSGPDARTFLQGLITNDIDLLAPEKPIYAALLTPQGKILFDFLIVDDGAGTILLDCPAVSRDALVKRLSMYRLRSKVEITARDDLAIFASWDGSALPGVSFDDPRLATLGRRSIAPRAEVSEETDMGEYNAFRMDLGVPEGNDFGSDKIFALDAGLDELHAIAFDKGCYIGQELTARMKHRSAARKRVLLFETSSDEIPCAGTPLMVGAREIGEITRAYGDNRGFALVRLDRLAEAGDSPIEAGGKHVSIVKPVWLSGLT